MLKHNTVYNKFSDIGSHSVAAVAPTQMATQGKLPSITQAVSVELPPRHNINI
jgi:hypothetical protein